MLTTTLRRTGTTSQVQTLLNHVFSYRANSVSYVRPNPNRNTNFFSVFHSHHTSQSAQIVFPRFSSSISGKPTSEVPKSKQPNPPPSVRQAIEAISAIRSFCQRIAPQYYEQQFQLYRYYGSDSISPRVWFDEYENFLSTWQSYTGPSAQLHIIPIVCLNLCLTYKNIQFLHDHQLLNEKSMKSVLERMFHFDGEAKRGFYNIISENIEKCSDSLQNILKLLIHHKKSVDSFFNILAELHWFDVPLFFEKYQKILNKLIELDLIKTADLELLTMRENSITPSCLNERSLIYLCCSDNPISINNMISAAFNPALTRTHWDVILKIKEKYGLTLYNLLSIGANEILGFYKDLETFDRILIKCDSIKTTYRLSNGFRPEYASYIFWNRQYLHYITEEKLSWYMENYIVYCNNHFPELVRMGTNEISDIMLFLSRLFDSIKNPFEPKDERLQPQHRNQSQSSYTDNSREQYNRNEYQSNYTHRDSSKQYGYHDYHNSHSSDSSSSATPDQKNYDVLGVKRDASKSEIHAAWSRLAFLHHPNRGGKGKEEKMKEINAAYNNLKNG